MVGADAPTYPFKGLRANGRKSIFGIKDTVLFFKNRLVVFHYQCKAQ